MFLVFFIIACAIGLPVAGSLTFWPVHNWYDFYIPIVLFFGGFFGGIIMSFAVTFIASLFVNTKKERTKPGKWSYWWLHQGIKCIDWFSNIDCRVIGANKLPKNQRFVLVCNHRSNYDPMIIIERFSLKKIAFISKESNFKIPMVGRFMRGSCYQSIDRVDREKALQVIRKCTDFVKDGVMSIGVFPEGTRQRKEIIGEFHEGVFNIAIHAEAPLVIAALKGTEQIAGRAPFRRTKVVLKIIGVIQPDELQNYTAKAVSDLSRDLMIEYLSE